MRPLLLLACLILGPLASAENEKLPELKLKNGKTFTAVTVTKKTDDGIAIMHESGTARIPFEQLPDDLVKTLGGFDPVKAAEARKATAQGEAAHFAEMEKAEGYQIKPPAGKVEQTKAGLVRIFQNVEKGVLCDVAWEAPVIEFHANGKRVNPPKMKISQFEKAHVFVAGLKGIDKDAYELRLVELPEPYAYQTASGGKVTVRSYRVEGTPKKSDLAPMESYERPTYHSTNPPSSGLRRVGGG